ncbi:TIGR03032 family protein [Pontixanthobacter aestiaquae]|uniref:TIGR03032 family protein n=1 Tax=Pontixanthobacter aestiaquae TaxID=1509367 RepID=A0A844Z4R7_9SPHN|nr:TIGR03032 family protein [Pontixanthobacter aestiaquae]MDN3647214.1 TIGR03032 family protein [Pontixanthobacter aestiaquae]MXO81810.1 TIGR03032 family protein [Pontixanthobacter aestiaquae]
MELQDSKATIVETAQKEPEPQAESEKSTETKAPESKIDINFSGGLAPFLAAQNISLAFTSYQSGRLYLVGHQANGKLALHEAVYPQAMGVAGDHRRIYLGTLTQLVRLENVLAPDQLANEKHDKVYVPRNMQTLGAIDFHEVGIRKNGTVVFVNTRYSCLCEPSLKHSFKPVWKPPFITKLAPEDRCHLNGLAMVDGVPKYVTAVCKSDVVDGWRDRRDNGGLIIDVETDEIVIEGLSMPHSPRWHDGKLWVLNSGTGELGWVDTENSEFVPFVFCPGFLRGLSFHGGYAFVGLSKPRYGRFEGLALDDRLQQKDADAWCGIQVISLATGDVVQWLRLDGALGELFDVTVLPGVKNPITLGPQSKEIQSFITIEHSA